MTKKERMESYRMRFEQMSSYENDLRKSGIEFIAGVDEAGRGPLAGPVVSACVVLPRDFDLIEVNDSKKLSEKKREELFEEIKKTASAIGVGIVDNVEIDKINILEATKKAMTNAINECGSDLLSSCRGKIESVLIDAVNLEDLKIPSISIVKGDEKSISIASASIIAKVTRDRIMRSLDDLYPGYGFKNNKGYGTMEHYAGIRENGITEVHRKSFLKVIH